MRSSGNFKSTVLTLALAVAVLIPLSGSAQPRPPLSDNPTYEIPNTLERLPDPRAPLDEHANPTPTERAEDRQPVDELQPTDDERNTRDHDLSPWYGTRSPQPLRPQGEEPQLAYRTRQIRRTVTETVMEPIPADELAEATKLLEAIESFKVARDDEARNAASVIIQEQLNSQFNRDVAQREKELAEVEQRVKTLREQLEKRKSLRDDIIGLRLKTIQNDAEGLGFPGRESSSGSFGQAPEYSPGAAGLGTDPRAFNDETGPPAIHYWHKKPTQPDPRAFNDETSDSLFRPGRQQKTQPDPRAFNDETGPPALFTPE